MGTERADKWRRAYVLSDSFGAWVRFVRDEEEATSKATALLHADRRRKQCGLYVEAWIEHVIRVRTEQCLCHRTAQHGATTAALRAWQRLQHAHRARVQQHWAHRAHRVRSARIALRCWWTLAQRQREVPAAAQGHDRRLLERATARWSALAGAGQRKRQAERDAVASKHFCSNLATASIASFLCHTQARRWRGLLSSHSDGHRQCVLASKALALWQRFATRRRHGRSLQRRLSAKLSHHRDRWDRGAAMDAMSMLRNSIKRSRHRCTLYEFVNGHYMLTTMRKTLRGFHESAAQRCQWRSSTVLGRSHRHTRMLRFYFGQRYQASMSRMHRQTQDTFRSILFWKYFRFIKFFGTLKSHAKMRVRRREEVRRAKDDFRLRTHRAAVGLWLRRPIEDHDAGCGGSYEVIACSPTGEASQLRSPRENWSRVLALLLGGHRENRARPPVQRPLLDATVPGELGCVKALEVPLHLAPPRVHYFVSLFGDDCGSSGDPDLPHFSCHQTSLRDSAENMTSVHGDQSIDSTESVYALLSAIDKRVQEITRSGEKNGRRGLEEYLSAMRRDIGELLQI